MKLLGIISVAFDITDQLLIRSFAIFRCWRKNGSTYNERVHYLVIDFKKACDSVRSEVLYNITIELDVIVKLVRLKKMCLNETYG
jgi:hypothetical protein